MIRHTGVGEHASRTLARGQRRCFASERLVSSTPRIFCSGGWAWQAALRASGLILDGRDDAKNASHCWCDKCESGRCARDVPAASRPCDSRCRPRVAICTWLPTSLVSLEKLIVPSWLMMRMAYDSGLVSHGLDDLVEASRSLRSMS